MPAQRRKVLAWVRLNLSCPSTYWKSFSELMIVCTTPAVNGIPTHAHARTRCQAGVLDRFSFAMISLRNLGFLRTRRLTHSIDGHLTADRFTLCPHVKAVVHGLD